MSLQVWPSFVVRLVPLMDQHLWKNPLNLHLNPDPVLMAKEDGNWICVSDWLDEKENITGGRCVWPKRDNIYWLWKAMKREKSSAETKHPPLHNKREDGNRNRLMMMNKSTSASPESFNSHSVLIFLVSPPFPVNMGSQRHQYLPQPICHE